MKKDIIVDCHNDTMLKMIDKDTFLPMWDLGKNLDNHIDIRKLKKGGLNVPFFAAYTPGYFNNHKKDISRTLSMINALYHTEKMNCNDLKIAYSLEGILKTIKEGKIAAVSTIEGGYSLVKENAIELLNQYYDLGVRAMSLTWNYSNELGEGVYRKYDDLDRSPSSGGLTSLGKEVIKKMNNLGMIIDVSHLDEGTFWDVIDTSTSPITASHSGAYNLKKHGRNLKDEQLLALKEKSGVIGVVLYPGFISDKEDVYVKDYVDHIDYIVDLIGIDYVAIGSDFDGASMIKDLKDASQIGKIINELEKRGYSYKEIEKIKYKNIFRVMDKVEKLREKRIESIIEICSNINFGEQINSLEFKANLKMTNIKDIDLENSKIIIDGIDYKIKLDKENKYIYFNLEKDLKETFHVITFKLVDKDGLIKKDTSIFYI